ncbi:MAG TPA: hypothetical protein VF300_01935 [Methanothrix sp.]
MTSEATIAPLPSISVIAAATFGISEDDITLWLKYVHITLAELFEAVRQKCQKCRV